ncbi:MAG: NAD(P)/FAD-dependent oxidoreductase [Candidatus Thermoplasmatota archaeon]|nr:NAD(P)/FAD-dependent oxidoreductase [Candidatus Thermoplasmatota archaeon]
MTSQANKIEADVAVIGGGPIGSYSALRLSTKGYSVALIEEDPFIGRPQQCAGLVNPRLFDLPETGDLLEDIRLNNIIGADIISPSGKKLELRGKGTKAVSIDRSEFDHLLFKKAVRSGAIPLLNQKAISVTHGKNGGTIVRTTGGGTDHIVKARSVIGCEGTSSITRRSNMLRNPKHIIPGLSIEMIVENGNNPTDLVCVLTGKNTARGFFSWALPAGPPGKIRIGLAAINGPSLREGASLLIKDPRLKEWLGFNGKMIGHMTWNYGAVPMGSPHELFKDNMIILGDSAGMAKPTSGGGIFPGFKAVDSLMSSIEGSEELNEDVFTAFRSNWKKGYGRELERSRLFRGVISRIRDEEIEMVFEKLRDPELLSLINDKGDIDHPLKLALSLLKKDPSLLKLIPRFLPHLRKLT